MGLAWPGEQTEEWGARQREWHGKGTTESKGNGKVKSSETGWKVGTDPATNGHPSKEVNLVSWALEAGIPQGSDPSITTPHQM